MKITTKNNYVLVTGGSRGIGRSIVSKLCANGFDVIYVYKSSKIIAESMSTELIRDNCSVLGFQVDVASEVEVKKFADEIIGKFGAPLAIINNAGVVDDCLMINSDVETWTNVVKVNLFSVYYICRYFVPEMILSGGGRVVNITSVAGSKGSVGQTNYSASKAAIEGFTRSLSAEVGRFNILVNCVSPGYIETDMTMNLPGNILNNIVNFTHLKRAGGVDDVSSLVLYLISDFAKYITGQIFTVDGGLTA